MTDHSTHVIFGGDRIDSTISLTRRFDHGPKALWAALSTAAGRRMWLAEGEIELAIGGRARLDFGQSGITIDSEVTDVEPGQRLAFSWSAPGEPLRPISFTVAPAAGGARLTVTLSIPRCEDAPRAAAGWAAHLEMLAAALDGVPIGFPFPLFQALRRSYAERQTLAVT